MIRSLAIAIPAASLMLIAAAPPVTPPANKPAAPPAEAPSTPPADAPSAPAAPAAPPAENPKPKDPIGRVAVPTKDDLQIRPGALALVTDATSGQPFWIFGYTVVNTTGKTQRFTPRFELVTGDGIILKAGSEVPPEAQRRLQRAMGKLEAADQFQIMGDILEGEANAREGFAIWPANKGDTKNLTLFISGLSRAMDTRVDESSGKTVTLRRTLQRKYSLPGQADPRVLTEAPFVSETWVMR